MPDAEGELFSRTRAVFQQRTSRELTQETAREITENAVGFFRVLLEWRRTADQSEARSEIQDGKSAVAPDTAQSEPLSPKSTSPGT